MWDHWVRDARFALRSLARRPGFTLAAMLTLALGIGANAAMFSVVNGVLLRPLEWRDPDGLVMVWAHGEDPTSRGVMSLPDIQDIAQLPAVSSIVGYRDWTATVTSGEEPELIPASRSIGGLMETFQVNPFMGRDLTEADAREGSSGVVVIGYRYWQDRLGGRPDVLGSTIEISEVPYEIIGIAPDGFDFPEHAQLWLPRVLDPEGCGRGCHTLLAIARLRSPDQLNAFASQLATLGDRLAAEYPESNFSKRFHGVRLADDMVGDVRHALWFILGAVGLVLLIACANVANLLLVRAETRRGEMAVRAALGAGRGRLVSQVLLESAMLAGGGALLGLLLARGAIVFLRTIPAGTVPRIATVSLDGRVLLFTLGLTVLVTLLFGLSPALQQARLKVTDLVSERRGGHGPRATRSRALLLTLEVALSVVLLAGAGLLLKSFDRLYRVELGFATERVTRFEIALPASRYDSIPQIVTFYSSLEERLAALPGVVAVGSAFGPPLSGSRITGEVLVEGRPEAAPGTERYGAMHSVTAGYLAAAGMPVLRGRGIEESDRAGTLPVAVVSETFVDQNFPNEDPLGRRFRVTAGFGYGSPDFTIVGVVGDVRHALTDEPEPEVYVPLGQFGPGALTVTMRTASGVVPISVVRDIVRELDPALPVRDYETVDAAIRTAVAPTRFYLLSMACFAGLAIVLACVGLYGVVAYIVSQRNREIGIRLALGARRGQVVSLVLRQGLRPAAFGIAAGLGLALALGRIAESMLFQVHPRDPQILFGVTAVLLFVTAAAAFLPALRASRTNPGVALRE